MTEPAGEKKEFDYRKLLVILSLCLAAVVWAITTLFEISAAKSLAILILVLFATVIVCLIFGITPLG